ncbi:MAG: amino acid adenylation domain-containing protein [Acidobacteriota bacterium]
MSALTPMPAVRGSDAATVSEQRSHPLSHGQEALWILYRLAPKSSAYSTQFAARVTSEVDPEAMRRALECLVERHATLRTTYREREGQPEAMVGGDAVIDFEQIDVDGESDEALHQRLLAETRRPFDLEQGPVTRVRLFTRGLRDHAIILSGHHISFDGGSVWILLDELGKLYAAYQVGEPAGLPAPGRPFEDYVRQRREMLASAEGERLWDAWHELLATAPAALELPHDRRRSDTAGSTGDSRFLRLGETMRQELDALAKGEGVTLYMLLLAAFQALLARYSGQDDLVIGSSMSDRDDAVFGGTVGYFVNTLPLRADLSDDPTCRELLARTREMAVAAFELRQYPFPLLIDRLQPERIAGRAPLVQTLFVYQKARRLEGDASAFILGESEAQIRLGALELEPLRLPQQEGQFELSLHMVTSDHDVTGQLSYDTALFEAARIDRMVGHLEQLLRSLTEAPDQRVGTLSLLTAAERQQLLEDWSAIGTEPRDACVHWLFEDQAIVRSESPALSIAGREISYGELDEQAEWIAEALTRREVPVGERVAVLLTEPELQVSALLGVLKSSCVFACLDPEAPRSRLERIVAELAPAALLVADRHVELAASLAGTASGGSADGNAAQVVELPLVEGRRLQPGARPNAGPEDPIYVAYTSGSTGRPKGIVQSHASFCQFLRWQSREIGIRAPKRMAQWSAVTYDASYCEIFGALCFGATLCVSDPATRYDPIAALEWLRRERVQILQVVPSFMRQLLQAMTSQSEALPDIEVLMLAGEAFPVDLARACREVFGADVRIYNLYGPSETVLATFHRISDEDLDADSIPIGQAIAGRQILVLDRHRQPCPIGVPGEIYVGSPHLTMGYLDRPEETRRSFSEASNDLALPAASYPSYRTGDLGSWRSDGLLEFGGRRDHQVKVRGVRVELEEIEAAILRLDAVDECAVAVRELGPDDHRLVAYVVAEEDLPDLRRELLEQLPAQLVPSLFMAVERLPRTSTGKLDRQALPQPAAERPELDSELRLPSTPDEAAIAEIWRELLKLEQIGVDDDFFALGGHSLLATQVIHRMANDLGVSLPLADFFAAPTVASLAAKVASMRASEAAAASTIRGLLDQVKELSNDEVALLLDAQAPVNKDQPGSRE